MSAERPLIDTVLGAAIARRREVVAEASAMTDALRWLRAEGTLPAEARSGEPTAVARAIATLARDDMSVAFSFWAHQMVLTYVEEADQEAFRRAWQAPLEAAEVAGSTALAAAMACAVTGAPLPVRIGTQSMERVEGAIAWASNLFAGGYLLVTAAQAPDGSRRIVALHGSDPGVQVAPYPELVDLQATASSSIRLDGARVRPEEVVAIHFSSFIDRVRPRFLLWQASFCWGLASRALDEAAPNVGRGFGEVFAPEHDELTASLDHLQLDILDGLAADDARRRTGSGPAPIRSLVQTRLDAALLAGAATRFEAKAIGGRGYLARSGTARRQREAAFLPIQSPTEGQLRWELSRSS